MVVPKALILQGVGEGMPAEARIRSKALGVRCGLQERAAAGLGRRQLGTAQPGVQREREHAGVDFADVECVADEV